MTSINELVSSGAKSWKWDENPSIEGPVVRVEKKQQTDIDTGELKFWKNGDPQMQTVFTLQAFPATSDDDGLRTIYARGGKYDVATGKGTSMEDAIFAAYRKAGITTVEGAILRVDRTGAGVPSARGKNAPNLYSALVKPGATLVPAAEPEDDPFS